jgi:hypothetical protein
MSRTPLSRDIRKLSKWEYHESTSELFQRHQDGILERITSLGYSRELWEILIKQKGE